MLTHAKTFGPTQNTFDSRNPRKNYDPCKKYFDPRNPRNPRRNLNHASHVTHVTTQATRFSRLFHKDCF